jgi:hypothetical protein
MEKDAIDGKMVGAMKVSIRMIKNTGMANIHGLMVENTLVNGMRVNKMELESFNYLMVVPRKEGGNLVRKWRISKLL